MNATLRVAWLYFSMLPVQRGLNCIAAAMLAVCAALLAYALAASSSAALQGSMIFAFFAGVFSAFGPAFSGGFTLRTLSTRSQLRLRPHGQIRAFLGTMLALTLLSGLFNLPMVLDQLGLAVLGPAAGFPRLPSPLKSFLAVWVLVYLFWMVQAAFSASTWRLVAALAAVAIILSLTRYSLPLSPAGIWALAIAGLAVWLSFARWYLNILCIPQAASFVSNRGSARVTLLERLTRSRRHTWNRSLALRQCLLDAVSPLYPIALGCIPALIITLPMLFGAPGNLVREVPMVWMVFPIGMAAAFSYNLVRRTRYLWLRAGQDRASLFHVAEMAGLRVTALTMLASMTAFLTITLRSNPDQALLAVVYAMEQAAFAAFMVYAGLCATRGWDFGGILVTIGTAFVFVSHVIFIRPDVQMPVVNLVGTLLAMLLLTALLRRYAQHRWLTLDWRIAQIPRLPIRT